MTVDVLIIGAGVVGCAVARKFALAGAKVAVVEKGADILSGASKANSAILHTGFDAPPGSLELACMQAGYREYLDIHKRMNLPLVQTSAMVVAWSDADLQKLPSIAAQARQNGVDDVVQLSAGEAMKREPQLARHAAGALLVPGEHVIDPWSPFLTYAMEAQAQGATFHFLTEVEGGMFDGVGWQINTSKGSFKARCIINCAGLFGDRMEETLLGDASFTIKPRKGQFLVYEKAAAELVRAIILPVPNERTKGMVICRTAFGNLLVGPTAEEQDDRERPTTTTQALQAIMTLAERQVPALAGKTVTATYAGLRPATDKKEYRIRIEPERNWITLGGIRSTGLTSSLGLAQHALKLYENMGLNMTKPVQPVWPHVPNICEYETRDWQKPDHGKIICHCELVTAREIEKALSSPFPPGDYGGLRRRTRAAMGICQGFNCQAKLAALSSGKLRVPIGIDEAGHE